MSKPSEQLLAQRMLETREKGFSYGLFLRRSLKRYFILIAIYCVLLSLLAYLQAWMAFCLVVGMVSGCFLRDYAWAKMIRRTWSFNLKITDWNVVQRLADNNSLD